jgi:hypothetical protein
MDERPDPQADTISICRDEECPACGWPETYAEGVDVVASGPTHVGCRKCGWWMALPGPCRYCGRDVSVQLVVPPAPEPPAWVCTDLPSCLDEQIRQLHPDEARHG